MSGRTHDVLISGFTLSQLEADLATVTAERDRLQEQLGQMELRLAAVTKERDAMLPDWMRLGGWLPKHWHIAKAMSGDGEP
jgi:multidrug resistance efflux pump